MGIMDWFRGASIPEDWEHLTDETGIKRAIEDSHSQTVAIFKHSTSCGTSHAVLSELVDQWGKENENVRFFYLDLLKFRSVSNAVAEQLGVAHQSPQLILIRDGKVVDHSSHLAIQWPPKSLAV